jgi:hypothetical protein
LNPVNGARKYGENERGRAASTYKGETVEEGGTLTIYGSNIPVELASDISVLNSVPFVSFHSSHVSMHP